MKPCKRIWLKNLRLHYDLTHEEVALMAGIERSTYTKAENGFPVSVNTAKSISNVFSISWTLFFDNDCDLKGQRRNVPLKV